MRRFACCALLLFAILATPHADACVSIYVSVNLSTNGPLNLISDATVSCYDYFMNPWASYLYLYHAIDRGGFMGHVEGRYDKGFFSVWNNSLQYSVPDVGNCYRALAKGDDNLGTAQESGTAEICFYGPPLPPAPVDICDDPGRTDGTCSPIVINFAPGPYRFSGVDDPVPFDIDADGTPDRIAWTEALGTVAFLALDRNNNSIIDDGSELFGDATRLGDGRRAPNGFEALEELDTNHDGLVNALDKDWTALLAWNDSNHDGATQPEEIQRISSTALESISTTYHWTGRRDASGNMLRYQGAAQFAREIRPIYDVYFRRAP